MALGNINQNVILYFHVTFPVVVSLPTFWIKICAFFRHVSNTHFVSLLLQLVSNKFLLPFYRSLSPSISYWRGMFKFLITLSPPPPRNFKFPPGVSHLQILTKKFLFGDYFLFSSIPPSFHVHVVPTFHDSFTKFIPSSCKTRFPRDLSRSACN